MRVCSKQLGRRCLVVVVVVASFLGPAIYRRTQAVVRLKLAWVNVNTKIYFYEEFIYRYTTIRKDG